MFCFRVGWHFGYSILLWTVFMSCKICIIMLKNCICRRLYVFSFRDLPWFVDIIWRVAMLCHGRAARLVFLVMLVLVTDG
jgi:hypothetical protein